MATTTIKSSKKAARELKALRTVDRAKKTASRQHCCRCCRCF